MITDPCVTSFSKYLTRIILFILQLWNKARTDSCQWFYYLAQYLTVSKFSLRLSKFSIAQLGCNNLLCQFRLQQVCLHFPFFSNIFLQMLRIIWILIWTFFFSPSRCIFSLEILTRKSLRIWDIFPEFLAVPDIHICTNGPNQPVFHSSLLFMFWKSQLEIWGSYSLGVTSHI